MSDDDPDLELLALLRKSLGIGPPPDGAPPETRVLESAQYICDNSIDVALDMRGTRSAAERIWKHMQERNYSTKAWREAELHPKAQDESTVNFIFTMDILNFSFWSYKGADERFSVEYRGKKWTGYWSLVAALQRALEEGKSLGSFDVASIDSTKEYPSLHLHTGTMKRSAHKRSTGKFSAQRQKNPYLCLINGYSVFRKQPKFFARWAEPKKRRRTPL
jgi:hypothetical protein